MPDRAELHEDIGRFLVGAADVIWFLALEVRDLFLEEFGILVLGYFIHELLLELLDLVGPAFFSEFRADNTELLQCILEDDAVEVSLADTKDPAPFIEDDIVVLFLFLLEDGPEHREILLVLEIER